MALDPCGSRGLSRPQVICPTGKSVICLSSPACKNIPLLRRPKSTLELPPSRSHKRGVSRSSRTWGAGCGGRGSVRRANASWTKDAAAYGEVVWSWRPDAGVKLAEVSADDGGKKARSPGRARKKPLKPLRGEGRVFPVNLW
jgi:hypothetical protein